MSSAKKLNEGLKNNPLIIVVLSFVGSFFIAAWANNQGLAQAEKNDIQEQIDEKASKEYVDIKINSVQTTMQIQLTSINNALREIKEDGKVYRADIKEILKRTSD